MQVSITLIATGFGGKNAAKSILAYKDKAKTTEAAVSESDSEDEDKSGASGGVPIPEFLKRRRPWGNRD